MSTQKMQLNAAVEVFLTNLRANFRAKSTVTVYRERLKPLLIKASEMGAVRVDELTPEMMDLYVVALQQKGLSPATISGHVQASKAFLSFCVRRGYIEVSPAIHIRRKRRVLQADVKPIPQEDLEQMIEQAKYDKDLLTYAIIVTLADTGCRVGELCSMNMSDLDMDRFEAVVDGKTGRRIVDFTATTAQALADYMRVRIRSDTQAVFTTRNGRISYFAVYFRMRKIGLECHARRYNPHSIRHRVGQGWVDQGANLEQVRQKLGHADISTTAIFYTHQDRERVKAATRRFSILKK